MTMLDPEVSAKYEIVVGLEIHCQLLTNTKIYAADANRFGEAPNTNISPITLGHPGTLPKLNKKVVDYAIKMGLACGCEISRENSFERKNYFYPDLPKGYQLTQDKAPICVGGGLEVLPKGAAEKVYVPLNRIHFEEDAGKSIHSETEDVTLVDLNRAGTPLIEIVTEPAIHSAAEAGAFLTDVRQIVRYLEICDGNMEEGSMRCDANISVRKYGAPLGKKTEVKNMNSIRNVQRAIDHEVERQIILIEAGEEVISETRTFDANTGTTAAMRTKEELNDYRYFPDPDLSPLFVSEEWIEGIRTEMPPLPADLVQKFTQEYGLPAYDAGVLTETKEMALFFDAVCQQTQNRKAASNWMMGPIKSFLNEQGGDIKNFSLSVDQFVGLIELVDAGKVNFSIASKEIFPRLVADKAATAESIAKAQNLLQDSSEDTIRPIAEAVLAEMPDKVTAFKKGKKGLIGMFIGQVVKKSGGKADPKKAGAILQELLA